MVLFDDSIYGGQSQPRSLADIFGGEKGLKNLSFCGVVHSSAGVAYSYLHVVAGIGVSIVRTNIAIERNVLRFDSNRPDIIDGIAGIYAEVDHDLIDLGRIQFDSPKIIRWPALDVDILADEVAEHIQHSLEALIQVHLMIDSDACAIAMAKSSRSASRRSISSRRLMNRLTKMVSDDVSTMPQARGSHRFCRGCVEKD